MKNLIATSILLLFVISGYSQTKSVSESSEQSIYLKPVPAVNYGTVLLIGANSQETESVQSSAVVATPVPVSDINSFDTNTGKGIEVKQEESSSTAPEKAQMAR